MSQTRRFEVYCDDFDGNVLEAAFRNLVDAKRHIQHGAFGITHMDYDGRRLWTKGERLDAIDIVEFCYPTRA